MTLKLTVRLPPFYEKRWERKSYLASLSSINLKGWNNSRFDVPQEGPVDISFPKSKLYISSIPNRALCYLTFTSGISLRAPKYRYKYFTGEQFVENQSNLQQN